MPRNHEWKRFAEWAKVHGDCVYIHVLGQPILILDTLSAAHEVLDLRSAIYSSRPRLVMAGELAGFNQALALMPYSPRFLALRRLLHRELTASTLQKYWPLHEDESRALIKKILSKPASFLESIRHYSGSVILRVTYGYQTEPENDRFLLLAKKVMGAFSLASQPGAWAVDILPWLRYLPIWFPGTNFNKTAAVWNKMHMEVVEGPFKWALDNRDSPVVIQPNFVSTILSQSPGELSAADEDLLLWASASLFGGGADTTVAAISSFFLAMALYPEVQSAAQTEIDRVITDGRFPQLSDRSSLPYVECVMREVLRWNPITPLGLPHLLVQDDLYRDYQLPAGTIVMANTWSILQDPAVFPSPQEFVPTRFLNDKKAVDVLASAFGFGRRAYPGVKFAEASMFIAIATALHQCNITNALDQHGKPIRQDVEYQTGTISHPHPFRCTIVPRVK
ncbi:cytochrome P450 [Mycena rebaudengoi]|nr:cytochrome P450 [Mycena rebaudengoi]